MLNPLMLLGLFGLAVPILIHLINRRRMRPRLLATLRFLDLQDAANAFAPVPRDLLQLLLRLLLLALFILLMARLTGPSRTVGPRALAMVLDNSMSMRRPGPDGRSLFEAHRDRILQLVRSLKPGDVFSFTLVGDKVFESTGFTGDRAILERAVTNAWVSDGSARCLTATLEDSLRELRSKRAPNAALMVFSDQQSQNYPAAQASPGLSALLQGSRIKPVFVLDPVETPPNVELRGAEFYPEGIYLGAGGKVTAHLYNSSPTQMTGEVSLKSGNVPVETRPCNLASGETAYVELRHVFESPNDSAWKVSLSDDGFSADNDLYTTVHMLKRRQVLLVTSPHYTASDSMTMGHAGPDLFACAVNPSEAMGQAGGTFISVKRIGASTLERKALSLYSMVVLYGIQELGSPELVQDLVGYVRQGGGVYIIPDDRPDDPSVVRVNPALFNETFAPLLSGFKLGALREPKTPVALDGNEKHVADPLLLGLLRGEWGTPGEIVVSRYFSTVEAGNARAALKTADGDILVAVADLGKGHVCIQTHSWDLRDTTLPRSLPFVSVVQSIVDRLSGLAVEGAARPDQIRVGDFHRLLLPIDFRGLGNVILEGPRSYSFDMSPEAAQVTVKDLYLAGAYRATHPPKVVKDRWLAVNRAPEESSVSFMSAEQLAALCGERGDVATTSDRLDGLFRPSRELYPWMLALVLVALAAETLGPVLWRRKKGAHEPGV